jgi:hypothetical protein
LENTMMADRGLKYAVAALGASVLLAGGAGADEIWQRYAPRCQPAEVAQPALADPCEQQLAIFGLRGPQVLGRDQGLDVEATGSIGRDSHPDASDNPRAPL